jgi:hypothetical protein
MSTFLFLALSSAFLLGTVARRVDAANCQLSRVCPLGNICSRDTRAAPRRPSRRVVGLRPRTTGYHAERYF